MDGKMHVYIVWEHYGTMKWIVQVYLTRASAEAYVRGHPKHDYRIETVEVLG